MNMITYTHFTNITQDVRYTIRCLYSVSSKPFKSIFLMKYSHLLVNFRVYFWLKMICSFKCFQIWLCNQPLNFFRMEISQSMKEKKRIWWHINLRYVCKLCGSLSQEVSFDYSYMKVFILNIVLSHKSNLSYFHEDVLTELSSLSLFSYLINWYLLSLA